MTSARLKSQNGDLLVRDGTVDTSVKSGIAKAWQMSLDGGTLTISDSLNISTVDDDGTGDYGQNYASNFSSGDKSINAAGGYFTFNVEIDAVPTSSADEFRTKDNGNSSAATDADILCTVVHGDLA